MTATYKKKLIENIIPIEAINSNAEYEKKPGVGPHPRSLHLWWAKRPHAAARTILFCQLVDDPCANPDQFSTKEDQDIERARLMSIAERLSDWKNSYDEDLLEIAREEIEKSNNGKLPIISDPFSGGGTITSEAQRIGLRAISSDINPIPFLIGKTMIEHPAVFAGENPKNSAPKKRTSYQFSDGLSEDFLHYGEVLLKKFNSKVQGFYPRVTLPKKFGGGKATVVCWLWAKTVQSPDPALSGLHVPLIKSMNLSTKSGQRVWLEPVVQDGDYTFEVKSERTGDEYRKIDGTVGRAGARCLVSGAAIPLKYIREEGVAGRMGERLVAIAAKSGGRGKIYIPADDYQSKTMLECPENKEFDLSSKIEHWSGCTNSVVYGFDHFEDLFNRRQLFVIKALVNIIIDMRHEIKLDLINSGNDEEFSDRYSAVMVDYLSLALGRSVDFNNRFTGWNASNEKIMHLFGSHRIPMVWDYGEANITQDVVGGLPQIIKYLSKCLERVQARATGSVLCALAQEVQFGEKVVVSTDPPYFDNVPYSNLSDFFYMWLRPIMRSIHEEEFSTVAAPKSDELVANVLRHGGKEQAESFFLDGMGQSLLNLKRQHDPNFPLVIYYAFKQSEIEEEGLTSRGWASFLSSVINSGLQIVSTWPIRSESSTRLRAHGANALSTSVVIVCRVAPTDREVISRNEFIRALKRELPQEIAGLQDANVSPADMPQSAIGPGMGVFSRYQTVLESDDSQMSVKTALQLINSEMDDYLGGIQGEFDPDTRFAISWYEQNGMSKGDFGLADSLARARGIAVESVKHAGIVESQAGKVRILKRDELDPEWEPQTDTHLTVWECLQYLVRAHEKDGISYNTALLLRKIDDKAEAVKDLAYCLYDICANKRQDAKEATAYNALIADWSDLTREAAAIVDIRGTGQTHLDF